MQYKRVLIECPHAPRLQCSDLVVRPGRQFRMFLSQ
jgi:hypothetical protein